MARSPLLDIYDPYGIQGAESIADLMPEEEKSSLLRSLANAGASGLGAAAWLLDTPGSFVRGLLSGGPGKALSSLWETSDERVTGRELLRQYGLAGDEDTLGNFGTGFAAEFLLDPLTYGSLGLSALLGQGAKTAAARAAMRVGIYPSDIALAARNANRPGPATFLRDTRLRDLVAQNPGANTDLIARYGLDATEQLMQQPLARSHRYGLPFQAGNAADLFGSNFGDFAARFSDNLRTNIDRTPYLGAATRAARAMFDARPYGYTESIDDQMFGRSLTQENQLGELIARRRVTPLEVNAARDFPGGEQRFFSPEIQQGITNWLENQWDQVPQELRDWFTTEAGGRYRRQYSALSDPAQVLTELSSFGLDQPVSEVVNGVLFTPRLSTFVDNPTVDPRWRATTSVPARGAAVGDLGPGKHARREDYTRGLPAWIRNLMTGDREFQEQLRLSGTHAAPGIRSNRDVIEEWLATNVPQWVGDPAAPVQTRGLYGYLDPNDLIGQAQRGVLPFTDPEVIQAESRIANAYRDLADAMRRTPAEYTSGPRPLPKYAPHVNALMEYTIFQQQRMRRASAIANELGRRMERTPASNIPGDTHMRLDEVVDALGFDSRNTVDDWQLGPVTRGMQFLANQLGLTSPDAIANVSWPRSFIEKINERVLASRASREAGPLVKTFDDIQASFKTLALASISQKVRDFYSGQMAAASVGQFDPRLLYSPLTSDANVGRLVGSGEYDQLVANFRNSPYGNRVRQEMQPGGVARMEADRLRLLPQFATASEEQLFDEVLLRRLLSDMGSEGLTSQVIGDEIGRGAANLAVREPYPGASGSRFAGVFNKPMTSWRTWNPFSSRGRGGNPNVILDLFDRTASTVDDANRIGTFLTALRKDNVPREAKRLADQSQVLYGPENFTPFERDVMTRIFPFYRFTRGITPLVYNTLTEYPAGVMGQSVRLVNELSAPSEDRHVPRYLRNSAAIPLDQSVPFIGTDSPGVSRFLTNIDLPHEGILNLFSPGIGNTSVNQFTDALSTTGQNLLGQTSPLIKGPLEMITGRQFYTGRDLNDLYSVLEPYLGRYGRPAEQLVANAPGGSRLLGLARTFADDRIAADEKAGKFLFNTLTGMRVQDVDQDRTVRLAAREQLNALLDSAPNISTFENLYIKPENLTSLSPEEQRQYLLYRILQTEATARRRAEKDPLSMLGL